MTPPPGLWEALPRTLDNHRDRRRARSERSLKAAAAGCPPPDPRRCRIPAGETLTAPEAGAGGSPARPLPPPPRRLTHAEPRERRLTVAPPGTRAPPGTPGWSRPPSPPFPPLPSPSSHRPGPRGSPGSRGCRPPRAVRGARAALVVVPPGAAGPRQPPERENFLPGRLSGRSPHGRAAASGGAGRDSGGAAAGRGSQAGPGQGAGEAAFGNKAPARRGRGEEPAVLPGRPEYFGNSGERDSSPQAPVRAGGVWGGGGVEAKGVRTYQA